MKMHSMPAAKRERREEEERRSGRKTHAQSATRLPMGGGRWAWPVYYALSSAAWVITFVRDAVASFNWQVERLLRRAHCHAPLATLLLSFVWASSASRGATVAEAATIRAGDSCHTTKRHYLSAHVSVYYAKIN